MKRVPLHRERGRGRDSRPGAHPASSRVLEAAVAAAVREITTGLGQLGRTDDAGAVRRFGEQLCRAAGGEPTLVDSIHDAAFAVAFVERVRRLLLDAAQHETSTISAAELASALIGLDAATGRLALQPARGASAQGDLGAGADLVVEVAHDIRSPLTSILFLVETLRNGHSGPINAIQERQLALVYGAAFGLSAIASDIVDLARGNDRLLDRSPEAFSVREVFQSVADILMPMVEEKGLAMRILPPPVDFRMGHQASLNRVLLNLATNAVKFTRQGFVELAAVQVSPSRIEFSVTDSGPGIPAAVLNELLEPLRGNAAGKQCFSSAGLGLAICARIVTALNGELRITTNDRGTRFAFTLDLPAAPRM